MEVKVVGNRRLYDIKETAASFNISTKSVRNLVKRGLLKPNPSLGKLLFSRAELDKFTSL